MQLTCSLMNWTLQHEPFRCVQVCEEAFSEQIKPTISMRYSHPQGTCSHSLTSLLRSSNLPIQLRKHDLNTHA